ncbi:MAG: rhodanese-like domain-containing protein [Candidatus Acidiferrales bacterium]
MRNKKAFRPLKFLSAAIILVALSAVALAHYSPQQSGSGRQSDPWSASQTIMPSDLIKELGQPKGANKPAVVCVGFRSLYVGAHVPGAVFHGAAQSEQGLADLKKWAQGVPRSANLVIYCGCCPLDHCPNLRPAFTALREMGFTQLRVLLLPHDFASDWVEKGYPVEKGTEKYSNTK